jgi:K+-transporting ATPase ATPase A chain
MVGNMKQGWVIYAIMLVLFLGGLGTFYASELAGNPLIKGLGVSGVSMEGKEVMFRTLGFVALCHIDYSNVHRGSQLHA